MKEAPRTPDELIQISINLQEKGLVPYGYVWQGHQYEGLSCVFLEILKGFGGEWLDDSQNVGLDSEEAIQAANWLRKLIDTGVSPKSVANFTENEVLQAFESGDAALMRNWPYAWSEVQKDNSPVRGKVGITRMVSKENQEPVSTLGSWGFSVLKDSQNKQAAYKVIKYLTSKESQKQLLLNSGYTPTNASLYHDKELQKKVPILRELEVALNSTQPRPQTPLYAQISDVLQKQLSSILTENTVVVKDKMNSATDKTQRILRSSGTT
jgi:multiple sugar transport system substrate-binding protein